MVAIGMVMVWAGYSGALWGYCLIRGYNVTLGQLTSPLHPYGSGKGQTWPPPLIPPGQLMPGAAPAAAATTTAATTAAPPAQLA